MLTRKRPKERGQEGQSAFCWQRGTARLQSDSLPRTALSKAARAKAADFAGCDVEKKEQKESLRESLRETLLAGLQTSPLYSSVLATQSSPLMT